MDDFIKKMRGETDKFDRAMSKATDDFIKAVGRLAFEESWAGKTLPSFFSESEWEAFIRCYISGDGLEGCKALILKGFELLKKEVG